MCRASAACRTNRERAREKANNTCSANEYSRHDSHCCILSAARLRTITSVRVQISCSFRWVRESGRSRRTVAAAARECDAKITYTIHRHQLVFRQRCPAASREQCSHVRAVCAPVSVSRKLYAKQVTSGSVARLTSQHCLSTHLIELRFCTVP